jgi:hypothetical protein
MVLTGLGSAAFVIAIAILYGSTMALSPRDGAQPIEKTDIAFYAVLGRDLATTGLETNTLPSGFALGEGASQQVWYHWGELWLASAVIQIFGVSPLAARYLIVLPLLLLAAAAMTGVIVRSIGLTRSRAGYLFGAVMCLLLAPIPLVPGPFFSTWAAGAIYGIAVFGLAAVAVLSVMHALAVERALRPSWALAIGLGSLVAFVLPAHFLIAVLGALGLAAAIALRVVTSVASGRGLPAASVLWWRTLVASTVLVVATVGWGAVTGHSLGGEAILTRIAPFNSSWQGTIAVVALGAGLLLAVPVAGFLARRGDRLLFDACVAASFVVAAGALLWGWRLAAFNSFYLFFGAIAVFATPVAAVAAWWLLSRLWTTRRRPAAIGLAALCLVQLEFGALIGLNRLIGPESPYEPIPVGIFESIRRLPADAKIAYACQSFEEISFVNSKLLTIDAHTARRIVPLCFEPDVNGPLLGAEVSDQVADAGFPFAPQAELFPDAAARPSREAVREFLARYGIGYLYADSGHPNTLVPDAVPVATEGRFQLLRVP